MSVCATCKLDKPVSEFGKGIRLDGTAAYCKPCYNAYKRRHYAANREEQIKRARQWAIDNREKHNENARRSCANPERKPRIKAYRAANADRYKIHDLNKHHKRRDAGARKANIKPEDWFSLLAMCDNRCFYCWEKSERLCMDHFVPISKGGPHRIENIVPACVLCNGSKWANMPMDYMKKIGRA
jgi:hypothetical protein